MDIGVLTSATGQHFTYSDRPDVVEVRAPDSTTDGNIREVFWRADQEPHADEEVCTVWDDTANSPGSPGGNRQMGLALRIAPATADGRGIRAITLTQNVIAGATWVFWVDVWSVTDPARPDFLGVRQFDLMPVVGFGTTAVPPPWHVCARVQGLTFRFKVWTGSDSEPTWRDPARVFTTRLPSGWDYPGHAGGYVGHLRAAQTARFSGVTASTFESPVPQSHRARRAGREVVAATPVLGWPTTIG